MKEKDEFGKEKQALAKQIEDLKQVGKRPTGNVTGEQVLKEKEERDQRIQILEKTVERQRDELRKEKDDHRKEKSRRQIKEKEILDTLNKVKTKLENDLVKHKQALKRISDELEKLKQPEANLPEFLSGTTLDELAAAYVSAIENIEGVTRSASIELGANTFSVEAASIAEPSAGTPGQPASSQVSLVSSAAPASQLASKAVEEKERRSPLAKPPMETRKTGRRLVRPKLLKPEEPQADAEMPDVDGSNTGKVASSSESDAQRSLNLPSQPLARKRLASSAPEASEDQSLNQAEAASVVKRPKGSDSSQDGSERQFATPEAVVTLPMIEHSSDAGGDQPHVPNEEGVEKEVETAKENEDNIPKEPEQLDDKEAQNEKNDVTEDILDKPSGNIEEADDSLKDQGTVEENQQSNMEFESEREEGELLPDATEAEEDVEASNITGSPEIGEGMPDAGTTPVSPARIDEEGVIAEGDPSEMKSPDLLNDEKNDENELVEETAEGSDKSNDGNDQTAADMDQTPETGLSNVESTSSNPNAEADVSKQVGSSTTEAEEGKQASAAASRVVNLAERAKERAMLRQSGAGVLTPPGNRGRGRAVRGRAVVRGPRGGRGGRGPAPSAQG